MIPCLLVGTAAAGRLPALSAVNPEFGGWVRWPGVVEDSRCASEGVAVAPLGEDVPSACRSSPVRRKFYLSRITVSPNKRARGCDMNIFRGLYAEAYDVIYRDKQYEAECDFLEKVFCQRRGRVRSVLDLGCGTGRHAVELARRGYKVVGVDISEEMLNRAKERAAQADAQADFLARDVRDMDLRRRFDACIAMFAVVGYQVTNADVLAFFGSSRRHLKKGGLFVFDVWFGPAVLSIRPEQRFKVVRENETQLVRLAFPKLIIMDHCVQVDYTVFKIVDQKLVEEVRESHRNRFFFPRELEFLLDAAGFRCKRTCPFMDLEGEPALDTWNVAVVAEAV